MRKIITVLVAMICAVVILTSGKEPVLSAIPTIDRFIGHVRIQKEVIGESGKYKGKLFILYHGDTVVMERDNKSGKIWIVGMYYSTADAITEGIECIIPFQRTEISPSEAAIGVLINEKKIPQC